MSTIKKIAIYHNLPTGGGIRMLNEVVSRLRKSHNVKLYIIGESQTPLEDKDIETSFTKIFIPRNFFLKQLYIIFVLPMIHKRIGRQINNNNEVLIATHDYLTKSPYLLRYVNLKKIYICQESQREFYEPYRHHSGNIREVVANFLRYPIKIIDRINVSKSNIILTNSVFSKKNIDKIYGINSKIMYPGVDSKKFKPNKKVKKIKGLLSVGGINQTKNPIFLINSLRPILNDYTLTIVGDGKRSYVDKVLKVSEGLNVKIIKNINDKELIKCYQESAVTCISSYNEPFGLSSIESQSCGTPVVTVDEGGAPETVINNITGYISKRDPSIYLSCVMKAIKNNKTLSKNCRNTVKLKWDWNVTLKSIHKTIEDES